jgi:hypothetical protein
MWIGIYVVVGMAVLIAGVPLSFVLWSWGINSPNKPAPPLAGTRSLSELQRRAENTAVLKIAEPERLVALPGRPDDPALASAKQLVTARSRYIVPTLTAAEVDEYANRLISGPGEPTPTTGVLYRSAQTESYAPFEVKTRPGANYYIKVVSVGNDRTVLTAFIRGGEHFETTLPVGTYKVRYAAGEKWYGAMLDFGLSAVYSSCDDRFDFQRTFDGYTGYTLELILQHNGNLSTSRIEPNEF